MDQHAISWPRLDEAEWPMGEIEFLVGEVTSYPTVVEVTPHLPENDGAKGDAEEDQGGNINLAKQPLRQRSSHCGQRSEGSIGYLTAGAEAQNIFHKVGLVWVIRLNPQRAQRLMVAEYLTLAPSSPSGCYGWTVCCLAFARAQGVALPAKGG